MRRLRVSLLCAAVLLVGVRAAGPAYGAIAAVDCPAGSGYAFESTTWPAAGTSDLRPATCPIKECLSGGSGKPLVRRSG